MSSDTYAVTIQRIIGPTLELRVRTTGAAGPTDYACTRSFVLATLLETYRGGPLEKAVEAIGSSWAFKEDQLPEHIDKFISDITFTDRHNDEVDEGSISEWADAVAEEGLSGKAREDRLSERHHTFVLTATFTDAAYLEGFGAGDVISSAAYDIWWDDPKRPRV